MPKVIKKVKSLFAYEYSEKLEKELDKIKNEERWYRPCEKVYEEVMEEVRSVKKEEKYDVKGGKYVMVCVGGECKYVEKKEGKGIEKLPLKEWLNEREWLEKIRSGSMEEEYVESLLAYRTSKIGESSSGKEISRKCGPYGYYLEKSSGEKKKYVGKTPIGELTVEEALDYFDSVPESSFDSVAPLHSPSHMPPSSPKILRIVHDSISIRSGKYGNYIHYVDSGATKPTFLSLKRFDHDIFTCPENVIQDYIDLHRSEKKTYKKRTFKEKGHTWKSNHQFK